MVTANRPLEGKVVLVTGASRGIGYPIALEYAKAGAHVIALARTVGGLEELDNHIQAMGGSTTLVPLDLKDFDALDRLGATIHERWGRLDVFFGNAGILGVVTPLGHLEPTVWQDVMDVNVTANWRLIRSLDPLLQAADAGRALFMTSDTIQNCRAYLGAYSTSKAALEALVKTYANENRQTKVCANLIDPGIMRTRMRAQYAPGEDPNLVTPPEAIAPVIVELSLSKTTENGRTYDFPSRSWRN